ncbi:unnamed protein product [Effrenium voratum]|nr:unnamed protein product [Effrenium voratum]
MLGYVVCSTYCNLFRNVAAPRMAWRLLAGLSAARSFDLGTCDLPRVDSQTLTWDSFAASFRGQPVLVTGLGVSEPTVDVQEVVQVSNGRNEDGQRRHVSAVLAQYLAEPRELPLEKDGRTSLPTVFLSDLLSGLQRKLWQNLQLPQLVDGFTARPILSIGVNSSGEDFHAHQETWLWLLQGVKAWWFGDAKNLSKLRHLDPCTLPSKMSGLRFCVQHPGEAIFFGNQAHATCNLEKFVMGVGAQGRDESWPMLLRQLRRGKVPELKSKEANAVRPGGRSALHEAAVFGHQEAVRRLLAARASPLAADGEGLRAAHVAALHGHVPLLSMLPGTPGLLQHGAMQGHVEVMDALLQQDPQQLSSTTRQAPARAQRGRGDSAARRCKGRTLGGHRLPIGAPRWAGGNFPGRPHGSALCRFSRAFADRAPAVEAGRPRRPGNKRGSFAHPPGGEKRKLAAGEGVD